MTTLAHRSPFAGPANGGVAARRALVRWAGRMFRREWRQQLLVVALLAVSVGVAVAGISAAYNAPKPSTAKFGLATELLRLDGSNARALRAAIADARRQLGAVEDRKSVV